MKELKGCLPTLKLTAAIKASPSSYSDDGKISLIGHGIDSIDEIPPPIAGTIRILFLSNNLLQDLSRIDQFRKLRQLSVANNNIKYFDQIQPLQSLECLERLSLIDNPVTQQPYYFDFVVELCRSVIQLDGRPVTTLDSVRAKTNCSKLDGILNQLLLNEIKNSVSLHLLGLLRCQREMKSKYFGLFRQSLTNDKGDIVSQHDDDFCKRTDVSAVLKVAIAGGVFCWIRTMLAANLARDVQSKLLRMIAVSNGKKHQKYDSMESHWDDLIGDLLKFQQKFLIKLIEQLSQASCSVEDRSRSGTSKGQEIVSILEFLETYGYEEKYISSMDLGYCGMTASDSLYANKSNASFLRRSGTTVNADNKIDSKKANLKGAHTVSHQKKEYPFHEKYDGLLLKTSEVKKSSNYQVKKNLKPPRRVSFGSEVNENVPPTGNELQSRVKLPAQQIEPDSDSESEESSLPSSLSTGENKAELVQEIFPLILDNSKTVEDAMTASENFVEYQQDYAKRIDIIIEEQCSNWQRFCSEISSYVESIDTVRQAGELQSLSNRQRINAMNQKCTMKEFKEQVNILSTQYTLAKRKEADHFTSTISLLSKAEQLNETATKIASVAQFEIHQISNDLAAIQSSNSSFIPLLTASQKELADLQCAEQALEISKSHVQKNEHLYKNLLLEIVECSEISTKLRSALGQVQEALFSAVKQIKRCPKLLDVKYNREELKVLAFTQLRAITLRTRRIRYLCNTHPPFKLKVKLCFLFQEWKKVVRALVSSKLFRRLWRNRKLILFFNLWTAAAKNSHYSKQCDKYYSVKSLQRAMCLLRRRSGPNQIKSLQKYLDIFTVLRVFRGWLKFCSSSKKSLANLTDDTRKIICRKWLEHWRMHHCHRVNFLVNEFSRVEKRCHRRKVREVLDNWLHIYKFRQYFSHYRQKKRYFHHFIRRLRERAKVGLMFHLANVAARFGSKQMRRALMTLKAYSGVRKMLQQNFILLQRRSRSTLASKFLNIWIKSFTLRQKFYTVHKFIIDRKLSTIFGRWVPTKANISSVLSMPHCDGRISSGVYSTACKDVFRDNTISDDEIESPDFFDEWCAEYWQLVTSKRLSCRLRHALRDWQRYTIARHALKSAFRKAKDSENKSCFSRKWNRWIVMFLRSLQGRIAQCSGQMLQSFERRTSLLASSTTSDTVYVQRFKRTELEEQNVSVKLTLSFLLDSMAEAKVAEADIALSVATLEERTLIMKGEIESLREQSRAILNKMELKNLRKCDDFKLKANLNQQSDYADDLEKANLQLCSDNRRQLLADLEKLYTSSVESNAQLLIQRDRNAQEIKAIQLLSQHCSNESNNILNKINLLKEERKNAEAALTNCLRLLETSRSAMEQANTGFDEEVLRIDNEETVLLVRQASLKDELVILHALLAHRRELNYSDLLKDREGKKKNLEDFNKLNFPSSQVRATTVIPEKKKFYERDGKYTDNIAKTSMDNQGLIKELDESIQTISRRVKERLQNSSSNANGIVILCIDRTKPPKTPCGVSPSNGNSSGELKSKRRMPIKNEREHKEFSKVSLRMVSSRIHLH